MLEPSHPYRHQSWSALVPWGKTVSVESLLPQDRLAAADSAMVTHLRIMPSTAKCINLDLVYWNFAQTVVRIAPLEALLQGYDFPAPVCLPRGANFSFTVIPTPTHNLDGMMFLLSGYVAVYGERF